MRSTGGFARMWLAAGMVAAFGASARAGDDDRALSATIDQRIIARWEENRVTPAPPSDDGEFLRRVTLDLTGKIPTAGEARDFLDDPRPDRRARVVERLLDGPAYIAHATNVELRLMIPEIDSDPMAQAAAPAFEAWLRDQFAANVGDDAIARAILTAPVAESATKAPMRRGLATDAGPSPLSYYLAKDVKSENLASSTARLFLGVRLECAQCHDHPFASWKRDQFWGYAAFFTSLERGDADGASLDPLRERPERREATIPGSSKVVKATFLDGGAPRSRPKEPARVPLADWMTARDNPYFARAAVNRIWAQFFGVGLVDPVDDMSDENPPSHPELLDELARSFAEHGYDRKFLIRAIVLSRPYQLSSVSTGSEPPNGSDAARLFDRMKVRGLTGEQLYDSLALAVGLPPEAAMNAGRAEFLERFDRHDETPTEAQTSILQALTLMNGRVVAGATSLENGATLPAVAEAPFLDASGRVEALFLATLSRRPNRDESARMVAYVESGGAGQDRKKALSDVFWALLNCPEFLLNH